MTTQDYPRFLQELLEHQPVAGAGVHAWLFRVARYLHHFHEPEEIYTLLESRTSNCERHIDTHEIVDAVKNSGACAWEPSGKTASQKRAEWLANPVAHRAECVPEFKPELAITTAAKVPVEITADWLKSHSPVPVSCSTEQFIESILEPQEKVLIFNRYKSQGCLLFHTGASLKSLIRQRWQDGAWFLCNPVDGRSHWNPRQCKNSRRSEESVTSFRYAVLECDQKPKEKWLPIWLKILVQQPLQIVSITDSAGKSIHALVRVSASSKTHWDAIKSQTLRPSLVPLGADDGALSAVRLTRLPGAYRGEQRQELLYLDPASDGTPIFERSR
jgi:hypothetical protein